MKSPWRKVPSSQYHWEFGPYLLSAAGGWWTLYGLDDRPQHVAPPHTDEKQALALAARAARDDIRAKLRAAARAAREAKKLEKLLARLEK